MDSPHPSIPARAVMPVRRSRREPKALRAFVRAEVLRRGVAGTNSDIVLSLQFPKPASGDFMFRGRRSHRFLLEPGTLL